jgi:hypothetical protein
MTITGYPYDDYDGTDEAFERLLTSDPVYEADARNYLATGKCRGHQFPSEISARADAEADFTAASERTVAPGRCTGCETDAAELLPWTPRERLCWRCVDLQLDLLAGAISEGNALAINTSPKVVWA